MQVVEVPELGDAYHHTGNPKPGWLARKAPSLAFYPKAFFIVRSASRRAAKGVYDYAQWQGSAWSILRLFESIGTPVHVTGLAHVRALERPCVFIGNHMSTLETFVLCGLVPLPRKVCFVIKPQLLDMPIFKHVMRWTDPIVVSRADPRADLKAVLQGGQAKLEAGISVIVFPQTTRAVAFDPAKFSSIGHKLAKRAGVPIIPVALKTDAWGLGNKLKDWGPIDPKKPIHIEFGPPIETSGDKSEHQQIIDFIQDRLRRWISEQTA
ncbi:MAG: lysophospholipid acyltransferase family protein [Opitutales bacterium]